MDAPGADKMTHTVEELEYELNRLQRENESLWQTIHRLNDIEEAARARLAHEIHSGFTQGVAAITMRLNVVRKMMQKKPEDALEELVKIEDLARRTTKEIRYTLFELRPMALEVGLATALEQLAARLQDTFEQEVIVLIDHDADQRLDHRTARALYTIAAEMINYLRQQAKTEQITINVTLQDDQFVMEIVDNGTGFDGEAALNAARAREGHQGLMLIQDRLRVLEGKLDLRSAPGEGTRITIAIRPGPIQDKG